MRSLLFYKIVCIPNICIILNTHILKQSLAAWRGLRIPIALIRAVCEPIGAEICPQGLKETRFPCPRAVPAALWYHICIMQNQRIVRIFSARRTKGRLSSLSGFAAALAACAALSPRPQAASKPQLSPFERASPHSSDRTACGTKKNRTCSGSFFTEVPVLKRESIFSLRFAILSLVLCSTDSA